MSFDVIASSSPLSGDIVSATVRAAVADAVAVSART